MRSQTPPHPPRIFDLPRLCDLSDSEMKAADRSDSTSEVGEVKSADLALRLNLLPVAAGYFSCARLRRGVQRRAPSRPCLFVLFDRSSSSASLLFASVATAAVSPSLLTMRKFRQHSRALNKRRNVSVDFITFLVDIQFGSV